MRNGLLVLIMMSTNLCCSFDDRDFTTFYPASLLVVESNEDFRNSVQS